LKWRLCSLSSVLKVDCDSRALQARSLGCRLAAGKSIWASRSQGLGGPRTEANREAIGLRRRSPGLGRSSLRPRSWARGRPAHHARALGAARGQLGVTGSSASSPGQAGTLPGTPACRREVKRKSPTSFIIPFAHSNVSKPFGKTVYSHTEVPTTFSLNSTLPRQLTIQPQHSERRI